MTSPNTKSARSLPRVQRSKTLAIPHEESVWAVSYADLLLVLLAFFVVFSSFDEKSEQDNILKSVALNLQRVTGGQSTANGQNSREPQSNNATIGVTKGLHAGYAEVLNRLPSLSGFEISEESKKITLQFQPNIFSAGQFLISEELGKDILSIYEALGEDRTNMHITIVGHSDDSTLRHKTPLVGDNFDLSAIRALQALKKLRELGFPEQQLSVKASSFYQRNVRSLSMEIQWVTI
ncbi:hypothetical protein GW916_02065 [bacterium]|nr:hypothetical protein [bacterium]